jgi:ferredoxin
VCSASLLCTRIAPTVFRSGDDGRTHVMDESPGEELRWVVEEAVQRCPLQAINLERTQD